MSQRQPNRSRVAVVASATLFVGALACQSTPPPAESELSHPDEDFGSSPGAEPDSHLGDVEAVPEASASDGSDVSDAQVEAFAQAYIAVVALEEKYTAQMQAAASPQEAESVQTQAHQEMQKVIEDAGLTVVEFEQMGTKAGDDEALRTRVEEKLMEMQQPEATAR